MVRKSELQEQILELGQSLDELKRDFEDFEKYDSRSEIEELKTKIISLRGLVNRKLSEEQNLKDEDPLKRYM